MKQLLPIITFLILLLCSLSATAQSDLSTEGNSKVKVEFIGQNANVNIQHPMAFARIGVRFVIEPGWHIYWENPGDSGLPTTLKWNKLEGFEISANTFPAPYRIIERGDITTFGYSDEVVVMANLTGTAQNPNTDEQIELTAHTTFLVCGNVCLPGRVSVSGKILVGKNLQVDPAVTKTIEKYHQIAPRALRTIESLHSYTTLDTSVKNDNDNNTRWININLGQTFSSLELNASNHIQFFPHQHDTVKVGNPKVFNENSITRLVFPISMLEGAFVEPVTLSGLLVFSPQAAKSPTPVAINWKADINPNSRNNTAVSKQLLNAEFLNYRLIDERITPHTASTDSIAAIPAHVTMTTPATSIGLLSAALFGLIAGLILNIMPCVLPVIAIKVMGFIEQASQSTAKRRIAALSFTCGVLSTFLVLALIVVLLKSFGHQIGWGFQFQYPGFVLGLTLVVFIVALGFFDLYTISLPGTQKAGQAVDAVHTHILRHFFDGILATVLATPCSAPFLGAALAFALTQSTLIIVTVFLSIGTGLALPYLLLSLNPSLIVWLPKPGAWMQKIKEFMGFLLLGAVIWLLHVLHSLTGCSFAILLYLLLLIYVCVWLRAWALESTTKRFALVLISFVYLLGACGVFWTWQSISKNSSVSSINHNNEQWEQYSDKRVAELLGEGKAVFIDFTAQWCLTCKANEALVLHSNEIESAFRNKNIVPLRADWTRGEAHITSALQRLGGNAVPYYVYIQPGKDPVILPTVLSKRLVLNSL